MRTERLHTILRLDGAANLLSGVALVAGAGLVARPLAIGSGLPVAIAGLVLLAYGVENLLVARRITRARLRTLIAVDLGFAAAVVAFAVADPTGAETWMRWALVAVAEVSAAFGVAKVVGLLGLSRRLETG